MEWAALHKLVLLTVAFCGQDVPDGLLIKKECQEIVIKTATLICDMNKDSYESCYGKLHKHFSIGKEKEEEIKSE